MATKSNQNKICVQVDTDSNGLHFMVVHQPVSATVEVRGNDVNVIVNESCVFAIHGAGKVKTILC